MLAELGVEVHGFSDTVRANSLFARAKISELIKQDFLDEYDGELIESVLENLTVEIRAKNALPEQSELPKREFSTQRIVDYSNGILPIELNPSTEPIETYKDHRMAMAFAGLALKQDEIIIKDAEVVKKSFPDFWDALDKIGFKVEEV